MLLHIHPNSANFKTAPRMKQPYFTRKMSLLPFKFIWVVAMLLITEQVSPAHSLELTTDRKFVFNFFRYFPQIRNQLSDQCLAVSNYFRNHSSDDWASKIVDSNSLIEPGLITGNLQYLGAFDECVHLQIPRDAKIVNVSADTLKVSHAVQYCTVTFPVSLVLTQKEMNHFPASILAMVPTAGICVPAACNSQDDIPKILGKFSQMTNLSVSLTNCVTESDLEFSNRLKSEHIIIITILVIIAVLCIAGTVVECNFNKIKESNWFCKLLYCFSLKRNLKFLFGSSGGGPQKQVKSKSFEPLQEKMSPMKLNDLAMSSNISLISRTDSPTNVVPSTTNTENEVQVATSQQVPSTAEEASTKSASPLKLVRPQVGCLHGIRFISFLFILIYHTFTEAQVPSVNLLKIIDAERNFMKQLITNASLWVDTFFLMSGFLVAHSMLYQKRKADESESAKLWSHIVQHPKRLLHRYLRLTPSVAGVLMLSILIEPLGSGPVWHQYVSMSQMTCHKNWWLLFLYVNNIFKLNQVNQMPSECLSYLWYLAVDMQFYLVSPILVMFLTHKKFKIQMLGVAVNLLVMAGSWVITAILMATYGLTPTVLVTVYDLPYINMVYKTSYCRIAPYCLGILLAFLLYRQAVSKSEKRGQEDEKKRPSRLYGLLLFALSLAIILTVTMLTYPWLQEPATDYHNAPSVVYGTLHRSFWALGWALLIYGCVNGYFSILNQFLGYSVFQFLSKLTYQTYLLHSVLISAVTSSVRQKIYFSDFNLVLDIYKYLILTVMVSIGTFVTFERPFINLEASFVK